MQGDQLTSTDDELADGLVRRARSVGGAWIVISLVAFGAALVSTSPFAFITACLCGVVCLAMARVRRTRFWRASCRRVGDATMQRAQWRHAENDDGRGRLVGAVVFLGALLAAQLWRR